MSTTIRVSDETKAVLEELKRPDESYDELLSRLAADERPIKVGAWSEEKAEDAREAVRRSRESFSR
ncbi:antitoxin VapB family protein [Halobacteriales archaeon Cl-PHB]